MDDNLESQSTDQKPENNPEEKKKRIDSIPLWLQGISENAEASRDPDEGEWQKEQAFVANQETGPTNIDLTESAPWEKITRKSEMGETEISAKQEIPLPDWIEESKETSVEDITSSIPLKNLDEEIDEIEEITEEVILEQSEEPEFAEPIESKISEPIPSDEISTPSKIDQGFEEIQLDEIEFEIEETNQDEVLPDSEEIPNWLREMIAADEKQKAADESKLSSHSDEPTQPVVVSSQVQSQIEVSAEEEEAARPEESKRAAVLPNASLSRLAEAASQEVSPPGKPEESEEHESNEFDLHLERDFSAEFDGTGFEPIQFDPPVLEDESEEEHSVEVEDDLPSLETINEEDEIVLEDWGKPEPAVEMEAAPPEQPLDGFEPISQTVDSSQESTDDIPPSLVEARKILEQGEVKEALEIIKSYISQSQFLNEIKDWLLIANEKFEENKSGLWEALGDISSHQGDYPNALNAYAKAIEYLELSRKNQNEIG